jgi:hypothetical protein
MTPAASRPVTCDEGAVGMRRSRFLLVFVIAVVATGGLAVISSPAGALSNQCAVGMWPDIPVGHSALKVACTYNTTPPTAITIHDYGTGTKPGVLWHWGATHQVQANTATAGSSTITVAAAAGANGPLGTTCPGTTSAACDVNHSIEGPGIPPGDFIVKITGTGPWTVTLSPNNTIAGGSATASLLVANTTARNVEDGVTNTGSCGAITVVCSATANFTAQDIGMSIGGGTIPDGTTIIAPVTPGVPPAVSKATLSCGVCTGNVAATGVSIDTATGNPTTSARSFTDVKNVSSSMICSPTTAANGGFDKTDIELSVTAGPLQTGIPANARITAVGGASVTCGSVGTSATITPATATATVAGKQTIVGKPTKTAPINGETAGSLGAELDLDPTTTPGSPPCSASKPTGFSLALSIYNAGSYVTAAPPGVTGGSPPLNFSVSGIPAVSEAQYLFQTRSLNFAGFLVQKSTNWDVVFGFLPVSAGVCHTGSLNSSNEYNFYAATTSQLQLPQQKIPASTGQTFGTGPAGTLQMRATNAFAASTTLNATVVFGTATTIAGACKLTEPRTIDPLNAVTTNADGSKATSFKCGN